MAALGHQGEKECQPNQREEAKLAKQRDDGAEERHNRRIRQQQGNGRGQSDRLEVQIKAGDEF